MRFKLPAILFLALLPYALSAQEEEPKVVDFRADLMRPIQVGDSSVLNLIGNVVLHHNGAVITCDSAIRYNDRRMECFKRVVINQETTYIYGDRADYDGNINLAKVYAPIIKMVDQDATLYTYNFSFNTLDNIGEYHGGGTMTQNDNLLESQRGFYYVDSRELIGVDEVELKNPDYMMKSDSVVYNLNTEIAWFYTKSFIWNSKGEILTAHEGRYETQNADYRFTRDAYILTADQEVWADSIDYNTNTDIAILRQDVQLRDEEQKIMAFGDYGEYWGGFENALLTRNPSLVSFDPEQDSLYVRADSMFLYTFPYEYDFNTDPLPDKLTPGKSGLDQILAMNAGPETPGLSGDLSDTLDRRDIAGMMEREFGGSESAGELAEDDGELPGEEDSSPGEEDGLQEDEAEEPPLDMPGEVPFGDDLTGPDQETESPEEVTEEEIAVPRPLSKSEIRKQQKAAKKEEKERGKRSKGNVVSELGKDDKEVTSVVVGEVVPGETVATPEILDFPEDVPENPAGAETAPDGPPVGATEGGLRPSGSPDGVFGETGEEADAGPDDEEPFVPEKLYFPADSLERIVLPVDSLGMPVFPTDSLGMPVFPVDSLGVPLLPVDSLGHPVIPRDSLGNALVATDNEGMPLFPMDSLGRPTVPGPPIPLVMEEQAEQDSLQRVILGFRNVRIYRVDFQAVADSAIGFSRDSTLHLYIDPVLWNEQNQIVSDVMDIYTKNEQLHKAIFTGSPFMSSEVDPIRYNQIKGKVMEAYFRDNEIYKHDVIGNAETYYYMEDDETGDLMGFLVGESADITFLIEQQQMDQIIYRGNPDMVIYPIDKIPLEQDQFLPGFKWEAARRPGLRDVFDRQIRPSERQYHEELDQPGFPLTEAIDADRARKIESGVWIERNDTLSPLAIDYLRDLQMGNIY